MKISAQRTVILALLVASASYAVPDSTKQVQALGNNIDAHYAKDHRKTDSSKRKHDTTGGKKITVSSTPSVNSFVSSSEKPISNQDTAHGKHEESWSVGTWIETVFFGLTALFTFLLWWVNRILVRDSAQSNQRQLRAYVGAVKFKVGAGVIVFKIKNFGQTPATMLPGVTGYTAEPLTIEEIRLRIKDPTDERHAIIWPNDYLCGDVSTIPAEKPTPYYIFGAICYLDVFGTRHHTLFQQSVTRTDNPLEPNIAAHTEGNEST